MNDIKGRKDIYLLVKQFYNKLLNDDLMKIFFTDLNTKEKLETHLNILVDFWDHQLFYSGTYNRNALKPHLKLHYKKPFLKKYFEQWLHLFSETVDEHYNGLKAHQAKVKAQSIATVMQIKISQL